MAAAAELNKELNKEVALPTAATDELLTVALLREILRDTKGIKEVQERLLSVRCEFTELKSLKKQAAEQLASAESRILDLEDSSVFTSDSIQQLQSKILDFDFALGLWNPCGRLVVAWDLPLTWKQAKRKCAQRTKKSPKSHSRH